MAFRGIEWVALAFPDVNMHGNVHAEIRDLSLRTMGYDPSAVIGTHSIPRRANCLIGSREECENPGQTGELISRPVRQETRIRLGCSISSRGVLKSLSGILD